MITKNAGIHVIRKLCEEKPRWSSEAVLFRVQNGEESFRYEERIRDTMSRYAHQYQLVFENQPLFQANIVTSVVKAGNLRFSQGIETVNSSVLTEIGRTLDNGCTEILDSLEKLRPLLEKLCDGYYILADTSMIPTDGQDHFFWNCFDEYPALCGGYENRPLMQMQEAFPAYLFPTKSDSCFDSERAAYYQNLMQSGKQPYALAFYAYGFLSALLEGHHKAYAAAKLGMRLPCLLLIPVTGRTRFNTDEKKFEYADFAGIQIPIKEMEYFYDVLPPSVDEVDLKHHMLFGNRFQDKQFCLYDYPDLQELTDDMLAEIHEADFTPENVELWLENWTSHADRTYRSRFRCAFRNWMRTNPEMALRFAQEHSEYQDEPIFKAVWEILKYYDNPDTEEFYSDYLAEHDPSAHYWNLVKAYWKK